MMEKAKIIAPLSNATCDIFALGLAIYYLASFERPTKNKDHLWKKTGAE